MEGERGTQNYLGFVADNEGFAVVDVVDTQVVDFVQNVDAFSLGVPFVDDYDALGALSSEGYVETLVDFNPLVVSPQLQLVNLLTQFVVEGELVADGSEFILEYNCSLPDDGSTGDSFSF